MCPGCGAYMLGLGQLRMEHIKSTSHKNSNEPDSQYGSPPFIIFSTSPLRSFAHDSLFQLPSHLFLSAGATCSLSAPVAKMFIVYRGLGGLLAFIAPFAIGVVLHFIIVTLILRHEFDVAEHLWSLGVSLFLGGLATALALQRFSVTVHSAIPTTPTAADQDVLSSDDIDNTPSQQSTPNANPSSSVLLPTTPDGLWKMATEPVGTDHLCFLAPNQIAAIYMMMGMLLVLLDFGNFILAPIGGVFGAVLLLILAGIIYFIKVMACSAPISPAQPTQQQSDAAVPSAMEVEQDRQDRGAAIDEQN